MLCLYCIYTHVHYTYTMHTCTDTLHILICTYYIHIKLYIHVHIVHMWVHTPMWGTHFFMLIHIV